MAENKISYLNRNYDEIRESIVNIAKLYYKDVFDTLEDSSIGSWLVDMMSDVADNLSYNIDRTYQETDIDSVTSRKSLLNIARTNGFKIGGPKCALVEIELSCILPMNSSSSNLYGSSLSQADENYCPYVKRGTLVSDGQNVFELIEDVDFASQFDSNGISNRQFIPQMDANGNIVAYQYKKITIARAGYSKTYSDVVNLNSLKPFLTIMLNDDNITDVESIIFKDGTSSSSPDIAEFFVDKESYKDRQGKPIKRFFEVDNLAEQYRFGYVIDENSDGYYNPSYEIIESFTLTDENGDNILDENNKPIEETIRMAMKGEWKRLKNKFTTEFQDNGSLKIMFGPGLRNNYGEIPTDAREFTRYMMSRMEANDYLGVLPDADSTMYIRYHVGGGVISNVGKNTINTITYLNMSISGNCDDANDAKKKLSVRNSLAVTNPTPSYGGKDAPSNEEIKYLIKYNSGEQNRCVTVKDYYSRISKIHPKYGIPFRHNVVEENNKVVIYALGLDYNGKLTTALSEFVGQNIIEYLKEYKCVNDFIEVRSGKIINLAFDCDVYIDKSYDKSEVIKRIIELIQNYMDIRKHLMGENIFLGDLEKEISKLDGVKNLISLRVYNKIGDGYSSEESEQQFVDDTLCGDTKKEYVDDIEDTETPEIDLKESDKILYSNIYSMFEIKYPERDIKIRVKQK